MSEATMAILVRGASMERQRLRGCRLKILRKNCRMAQGQSGTCFTSARNSRFQVGTNRRAASPQCVFPIQVCFGEKHWQQKRIRR